VTAWNQGLPIREIDVLWMTAGLRCDGCLAAITAATRSGLAKFCGGRLPMCLDFCFFNVANREADSCFGSGVTEVDANERATSSPAFRPTLFDHDPIGPTRNRAVTSECEQPACDKPGRWHRRQQQNAGDTCRATRGA